MFESERLEAVELAFGFRYPQSFLDFAGDITNIANSRAFSVAFPGGRLVDAALDIQSAWDGGLPDKLVPFMLEVQSDFTDYYCFNRIPQQLKPSVFVFADHAIVHDWDDFDSFIRWIRRVCREIETNPDSKRYS
jgi:hypothetical protein